MSVICPSILAASEEDYRQAIEKVAGFAHRLQIDLTDGQFAQDKTIAPGSAWWPVGIKADIHLMFKDPLMAAQKVAAHKPNLIIVHAEAQGDFEQVVKLCQSREVKIGVALLADTPVSKIAGALDSIDHVLIFSGHLGEYGGSADLALLSKVQDLKAKKPGLEVGWDGGINTQNISQLAFGGVDVFDVGGFIQNSENPERAYKALERIANETGTT